MSAEQATSLLDGLVVDDVATEMRVDIARDHIVDIARLDLKLDEYSLRLTTAVKASKTTLTRLFGVGPLNAALILGDVGDVSRFPDRNHFASYTGTAPIAVSSGDQHRHRLSRSGNRRLNSAIHIAAISQIRYDTPGRVYYRRKLAEGKSTREALRCLKRRISDAVFQQLRTDQKQDQTQNQNWPRWPSQRGLLPHYKSPATLRANGKPQRIKSTSVNPAFGRCAKIPPGFDSGFVSEASSSGVHELPVSVWWSSKDRVFDLGAEETRIFVYERVLQEGTSDDVIAWIQPRELLRLWDQLRVTAAVAHVWDPWVQSQCL